MRARGRADAAVVPAPGSSSCDTIREGAVFEQKIMPLLVLEYRLFCALHCRRTELVVMAALIGLKRLVTLIGMDGPCSFLDP